MIRTSLLAFGLSSTPALADFVIEAGSYFVIHRSYDHQTDIFSDGAPEGEEDACFQITDVRLDQKQIDFVLISGHYSPWWVNGEILEPGFPDAYVPAIGFMKNRPDANWTDFLHAILKTVAACPVPSS